MQFQDKSNPEKNSKSFANRTFQSENTSDQEFSLEDNRPEAMLQRKIHQLAKARYKIKNSLPNSTGDLVQRYPEELGDDDAKALRSLYLKSLGDKEENELTPQNLQAIKAGVYKLTDLFLGDDGINANCIGWAIGSDANVNPGSKYTWEQGYTMVDEDAADAKIILWGEIKKKKKETDAEQWDVRHASVKLSHAEIEARSKVFKGFKKGGITAKQLSDAGIENPCWTSAGGMGFGIFVHPQSWFEGGDFGTALSGAKKK